MKNQRTKTKRGFRASLLIAVIAMTALLIGCFALTATAETVGITVDPGTDLDFSGSNVSIVGGIYTKEYDGTALATGIRVKENAVLSGVAAGDEVLLSIRQAYFADAAGQPVCNAGAATKLCIEFELTGAQADAYTVPTVELPATIAQQTLYWNGSATASAPYQPDSDWYSDLLLSVPEIVDANGNPVTAVRISSAQELTISVQSLNAADVHTTRNVTLEAVGADVLLSNYRILPMPVVVDIIPLEITDVTLSATTFTYDPNAFPTISATAFVNGYECELTVIFAEGFDGSVGVHTVTVKSLHPGYAFATQNEFQIEILPKEYRIGMDSLTVVDTNDGAYYLTVRGLTETLPNELLTQILYSYTKDGVRSDSASGIGVYTVTADLSQIRNYVFADESGAQITQLTATLKVNPKSLQVGTADLPSAIIVTGDNGADVNLIGTLKIPQELARKAIKGFHAYKAYELTLSGGTGNLHTLLIGIDESLYGRYLMPLTASDLYLYDAATGTSVKVSEATGFSVTVKDGYIQIDGVAEGTYTFIIAPTYDAPFWITAPGITLIVLLILALLVLMFFIGVYLYRVQSEANQVLAVDTVGDAPAVEIRPVPDQVDAEKVLQENLEELEEALDRAVKEEEESQTVDVSAETEEAVAEAKQELAESALALEDEQPSEDAEEPSEETNEDEMAISAEELTESVADEVAEELEQTVPMEEEVLPEPDEELVRAAVAEAMAENWDEEALDAEAELSAETLRHVADAIIDDVMHATMLLPEIETVGTTDEAVPQEEEGEQEVCAIIADAVAVAFDRFTVDGEVPAVLEGTNADIISAAVLVAAKNHIPQSWSEELSDTVTSAVTEELIARLVVVSAETDEDAEEPIIDTAAEESSDEETTETDEDTSAVVTMADAVEESTDDEEETEEDADDEEEEESGEQVTGFGAMPQSFIDAVADAEAYNDLLERERLGELHIVTRYKRSFMSRLIQSQGNVQNYYSILKNALLMHKGVKSRLSWNYEAFNKGRIHLAKMNAKTKTLYLYLALDPEELKDTKYGIVDVSSKKKYASVPVLMKIKGDRKFKYALELIQKLCEEQLELPRLDVPEVDYRVDYQTTEELVESGYVRKLVAGVSLLEEAPADTVETSEKTIPSDEGAVAASATEEITADDGENTEA